MPSYHYKCIVNRQRDNPEAPPFLLFPAPADEILQWAAIKRLEDQPGHPQRRDKPSRVSAIKRYLQRYDQNTIPTSIIVSLRVPDGSLTLRHENGFECADLNFNWEGATEKDKPGIVVDGQHRLLGVAAFDGRMRLNVVALFRASDPEIAFQFLVINNKACKVPTDHIRALALDYRREELAERLQAARLTIDKNVDFVRIVDTEEASPFRAMVDWPANRDGEKVIKPSAIEMAFTLIQSKNVEELQDEDSLVEFFYSIWRATKVRWPARFNAASRLLSNVGVVCMTRYVTEALVPLYDWGKLQIDDPAEVQKQTSILLDQQEEGFWDAQWTSASYDTRLGHDQVVDALVRISRNVRSGNPWFEKVDMVVPPVGSAPG